MKRERRDPQRSGHRDPPAADLLLKERRAVDRLASLGRVAVFAFGSAPGANRQKGEIMSTDHADRELKARLFRELADDFEGKMRIAKLDVDHSQQVAMDFQVSSIPTFILFKGGEVAGRMMGAMSKPAFEAFINENV